MQTVASIVIFTVDLVTIVAFSVILPALMSITEKRKVYFVYILEITAFTESFRP